MKDNYLDLKIQLSVIVFFCLLGFGGLHLYMKYGPKHYFIYHSIVERSHYNNKWELFSGIRYGNWLNTIIEYQIYPCFEGTKKECEKEKLNNDIILEPMLIKMKNKK